ncbi:HlyD family secretion protein [Roseivirga sp. BDSF3-8]|uniref:HlyD family secretion protein n=1 Tax=Roseivirga sp. BDSF3-8 TaxID=3241598 RepID=UPI003531DA7E
MPEHIEVEEQQHTRGEVTVSQEEVNNLQLRSEEVQEILSHAPVWIIRWGITVIFFVLLVIMIASYFIKYPDTITSRVVLTTLNPPATLVARDNGQINLFVEDGEAVEENEFLGVLENPANTEDALYLIRKIENLEEKIYSDNLNVSDLDIRSDLNLGSLQPGYLRFMKSIRDYNLQSDLQYHQKQIASLRDRIEFYQESNASLRRQNTIHKEKLELDRSKYETDSSLYESNAISRIEFEQTKSNYLQSKRQFEADQASIINNRIQISQIENQINELRLKELESNDNLRSGIDDALKSLQSEISAWKRQFLFEAPIAGSVSLNKVWTDNQYVTAGETVFNIIPESQDIIGNVEMPVVGSGKVEVGQTVNLKFDNYPYDEYGMVLGEIENISMLPTKENTYIIRISLPNGLMSSYKKDLEFKQQMQGSAEIITEDLRLIERLFNQLRSVFDDLS